MLFPELAVCGYPPRDLLEKPAFVERSQQAVNEIARAVPQITIICGFVSPAKVETGKSVMNSAAVLRDGTVQFVQSKMLLPTYDVFDEIALFRSRRIAKAVSVGGKQFALTICEDAWNDKHFWHRRLYASIRWTSCCAPAEIWCLTFPLRRFIWANANCAARCWQTIARDNKVPVVLVNQVGGNDSLIFDGSSMVIAPGRPALLPRASRLRKT